MGTARTWWNSYDRVYLSTDDVAGNADDVSLGSGQNVRSLISDADGVVTNDGMQPGESYTTSVNWNVPSSQTLGDFMLFVKRDLENSYYELPGDDDPWSAGVPVVIEERYPDLVVTDI